jgi:hypothetical protein
LLGTVVSGGIALIVDFFCFNADYSNIESLQYEDDSYFYYVKAVPKKRSDMTNERPARETNKTNKNIKIDKRMDENTDTDRSGGYSDVNFREKLEKSLDDIDR